MSLMYRWGSCAWISMGLGMPPGPPRVRAVMKRWNKELCRAVATCGNEQGVQMWQHSTHVPRPGQHASICPLRPTHLNA